MNNILEPLQLSRGSHKAGSGKGCAMNLISWENGDTTITDYPACSDAMLARIVQSVNDNLAGSGGFLSPENSTIALDLGHATVGTAYHGLSDLELRRVYTRCACLAARKVVHLDGSGAALHAIEAAEKWANDPSEKNAAYAAAAAANANAANANANAAANAANAAYAANANANAYAAAYAANANANAAAYAANAKFNIDLAWEIIALFKRLTGTTSAVLTPETVSCAVEKMLAHA